MTTLTIMKPFFYEECSKELTLFLEVFKGTLVLMFQLCLILSGRMILRPPMFLEFRFRFLSLTKFEKCAISSGHFKLGNGYFFFEK